jgi:hypothetical protein
MLRAGQWIRKQTIDGSRSNSTSLLEEELDVATCKRHVTKEANEVKECCHL